VVELYHNFVSVCLLTGFMIAGNTADYVNAELERVARELVSDQQ
jgi:hypothetical protein